MNINIKKSIILPVSVILITLLMTYCVSYIVQQNKQNVVKFEVSKKDNSEISIIYDLKNYEKQLYETYTIEIGDGVFNIDENKIYEKLKRWDSKTDPIFKLKVSTNELDWTYYGTARELDSIKCILKDSIVICSARVIAEENARKIAEEKQKLDMEKKLNDLAKKIGETCK